ncbi:MAG TPA: hypothetical protein VM285_01300 [Polyangia bacterium]|nr:hypothetical protein [Polyangia bacterium]
MSTPRETNASRSSCEVVRLKVEGARTTVNTLRDEQTARGLSLVCPFPALEVDIPVMFGSGEEMRRGAIHRIGVEDDPRSGLPRLRLSVRAFSRTAETRATVVSPPAQSLLGEASRATRVPQELDRAATDLDVLTEASDTANLLDELLGGKRDRPTTSSSYSGLDSTAGRSDPEWAALGEIPMPGELSPRSPTRRRKRLASLAAWTTVFGLVAGGAYVLDRCGLVGLEDARRAALGFFRGGGEAPADRAEPAAVAMADVPGTVVESSPAPPAEPASPEAPIAGFWTGSIDTSVVAGEVAVADLPALDPAPEKGGALVMATLVEAVPAVPADDKPDAVVDSEDEVTLVLPTRWPAEYSTAYRLRDPNGIVVDIPGGLVRKEGWLDVGVGHPMIRSVKAMQRESGARFVVYVNGELPRFITSSKTAGIMLRLFREEGDEPAATEQVAMID